MRDERTRESMDSKEDLSHNLTQHTTQHHTAQLLVDMIGESSLPFGDENTQARSSLFTIYA